ncbi:MAG: DUF3284 domain-containing protein [Turicibacter sp.]|nr:DUF3284 domain-containing protein [Turicibacter sp.]
MIYKSATLNVSATEFYDFVLNMIVADIKTATGRSVPAKNIKQGFKYTKKMKNRRGQVENVSVVVSGLVTDRFYEARFKSSTGINVTSYDIEATSH